MSGNRLSNLWRLFKELTILKKYSHNITDFTVHVIVTQSKGLTYRRLQYCEQRQTIVVSLEPRP